MLPTQPPTGGGSCPYGGEFPLSSPYFQASVAGIWTSSQWTTKTAAGSCQDSASAGRYARARPRVRAVEIGVVTSSGNPRRRPADRVAMCKA
jgi:hypothetical protein